MYSLKSYFVVCFLMGIVCLSKAAEKNDHLIPVTGSSLPLSKWDSIIKPLQMNFVPVEASCPGLKEGTFSLPDEEDPTNLIFAQVSPGLEDQYLQCLINSLERGKKRAPSDIAQMLRHKARMLELRMLNIAEETGGEDSESTLAIIEGVGKTLQEIKETESSNFKKRIQILLRNVGIEVHTVYTSKAVKLRDMVLLVRKEQKKLAEELTMLSAERGHWLGQYICACQCEDKGEIAQAKEFFTLSANQNFPHAQFHLGLLLESQGDYQGAEELYFQAALNGDSFGLLKVAKSKMIKGEFLEAKQICALMMKKLYQRPQDDCFLRILSTLGQIFEREGDCEKAEILYASSFDSTSVSSLKEMKEKGKLTLTKGWFMLSSEDDGDAEFMLGLLARDQLNKKEKTKLKEQEEHLKQAALKGHPGAMVALGFTKQSPTLGVGDLVGAEELFRQAHLKGYIPGTFHLASCIGVQGSEGETLLQLCRERGYPIEKSRIESIVEEILRSKE